MGLDKDDTIVKRRMAQKMQFLAEDVAAAREPTTAELKRWYEQNSALFEQPSRVSFRHLYFSPDRRGDRARDDAAKALTQLAGQPQDTPLAGALADPFMFQDYYPERAPESLGKEFGPQFAQAVAQLPPGAWQGPIASGFGWHLVYVDTRIPGRVPVFEEVEPDVKNAWLGEQKAQAWQKAYVDMRAKYTVLLPAPPERASARAPAPDARNEVPMSSKGGQR
jgi:parvulin-like peptidyl-prolyl isomerase